MHFIHISLPNPFRIPEETEFQTHFIAQPLPFHRYVIQNNLLNSSIFETWRYCLVDDLFLCFLEGRGP